MCVFCAAIPAAAAVGAKINADQNRNPAHLQRPIGRITGFVILLALCAVIYHRLAYPA